MKCRYYSKHSKKSTAKKGAAHLRRAGYRARVTGKRGSYIVKTCGKKR